MNVEEHFLAKQTLVTEEVTYSQDEDGNIMILQDIMYVTLTPQQQIALKSLLEAHIDTLQFAWSKLWNLSAVKRLDVLMIVNRKY